MIKSQELYRAYLDLTSELDADGAGRRAAWRYMQGSSAIFGGHPQPISYTPRLLNSANRDQLDDLAVKVHGILTKIIAAYQNDPAYRDQFRFDPRIRELTLLPSATPQLLPYGRFDCCYDERTGHVRFIEFNADCSSGMNKTREALNAIGPSEPFQAFCDEFNPENDMKRLFQGWVRDFLQLYGQTEGAKEHPHVAIAVCLDGDDLPLGELEYYAMLFEEAGAPCCVGDVRDFSFNGEHLICEKPLAGTGGQAVDAIWRYCIAVDLLQHWSDCQAFLDGIRAGAAPLFGGFVTQVVHDKQLFALLRQPATQALLTEEECILIKESVPFTAFLDDPSLDLDAVKAHPERWVIKPTDWYGNVGVHVGGQYSRPEWAQIVESCVSQGGPGGSAYLLQEYCPPPRIPVIPLYGREQDYTASPQNYSCQTGMYVFNGQFAGLYNRLGPDADATEPGKFIVAPTLYV